jgi:Ca2+-binding EF-hand superfamily protein
VDRLPSKFYHSEENVALLYTETVSRRNYIMSDVIVTFRTTKQQTRMESPRSPRRLSLLRPRSTTFKTFLAAIAIPTSTESASSPRQLQQHLADFDSDSVKSPPASPQQQQKSILETLTPQEIQKLNEQFKNIDSIGRGNGQLSLQEFTAGLQHLGVLGSDGNHQQQEGLAHVLFSAFDFDGSGSIDYEEFLLAMSVLMKGGPEQKIQFAFSMIDKNNNGRITLNELKKMIYSMFNILAQVMNLNMLNVNPDTYAQVLFERMDSEKTGEVTLQQYKKFALNRANRNLLRSLGLYGTDEQTDVEEDGEDDDVSDMDRQSGTTMIGFGSAKWRLVLELQIAVRIACQMIAYKPSVNIEDFSVVVQFKVPKASKAPSSSNNTAASNADTVFTDYAPLVFRHIRQLSGISEKAYSLSMGPEQIMSNLLLGNLASFGEKVSDGKSGSFFFYSFDERFMVKTIPQHEFETLLEILPDYYEHLKKHKEKTMLMRIVGCHQMGSQHFVILGNIFDRREPLSVIYDLKGSTIGRSNPNGFVRKDNDLKHPLYFGDMRPHILDQLVHDVK